MNKIPPLNLRLDTEGDSCIIIRLSFANPEARTDHADAHTLSGSPDPVNAELNRRAIYLAHRIQDAIGQALPKAIIEAIPSFDAVGVYYDLDRLLHVEHANTDSNDSTNNNPFAILREALEQFAYTELNAFDALNYATATAPGKIVEIPICYDLEYGIDLPDLSQELGLSIEQIIDLHTREPMHIFMLGFSPGLPFHGLFDPKLNLPRRTQPRTELAPGSVGIANRQGVIYPFATPGGWHIVGRTPLRLFNADAAPYTLYQAGDKIQFKAISKAEFLSQQAHYGTGER